MNNINAIEVILCNLYREENAFDVKALDSKIFYKLIDLLEELKEYIK